MKGMSNRSLKYENWICLLSPTNVSWSHIWSIFWYLQMKVGGCWERLWRRKRSESELSGWWTLSPCFSSITRGGVWKGMFGLVKYVFGTMRRDTQRGGLKLTSSLRRSRQSTEIAKDICQERAKQKKNNCGALHPPAVSLRERKCPFQVFVTHAQDWGNGTIAATSTGLCPFTLPLTVALWEKLCFLLAQHNLLKHIWLPDAGPVLGWHSCTHTVVWCCMVSPWRRPPCGF